MLPMSHAHLFGVGEGCGQMVQARMLASHRWTMIMTMTKKKTLVQNTLALITDASLAKKGRYDATIIAMTLLTHTRQRSVKQWARDWYHARFSKSGVWSSHVSESWQAEVSACTRGEVRLFDYNGSNAKGVKIINQPCPHSYHMWKNVVPGLSRIAGMLLFHALLLFHAWLALANRTSICSTRLIRTLLQKTDIDKPRELALMRPMKKPMRRMKPSPCFAGPTAARGFLFN